MSIGNLVYILFIFKIFLDKYIFSLKIEYCILIIYFFSKKNKCSSDKKYSIIFAENQQEVKTDAGILQTPAIEKIGYSKSKIKNDMERKFQNDV